MMNETLGKIHFAGSLFCMNVVFMPMFLVGLAGVSRRLFDGGASYSFSQPVLHLNVVSSWGAWIMALFQIPFIFNFFWSIWKGQKVGDRTPWEATTIEWAAPSPPPHGNLWCHRRPIVARTNNSVPGAPRRLLPAGRGLIRRMDIPLHRRDPGANTGLTNGKIAIRLFLASEVMLFGALFASYILIRTGAPSAGAARQILNVPLATFNTLVLISSSVTMVMSWASLEAASLRDLPDATWARPSCSGARPGIRDFEYSHKFEARAVSPAPTTSWPSTSP